MSSILNPPSPPLPHSTTVLRLYAENDRLKIQELEDRKKIQKLLGRGPPTSRHLPLTSLCAVPPSLNPRRSLRFFPRQG